MVRKRRAKRSARFSHAVGCGMTAGETVRNCEVTMSAETPQSDAQLLHAVRVGDADAYARLRDRHVAAARALAQQLVPAEEAEDVVDESFTRVLHEVGRGGGPESGFRAYLLAVVRRVVQDRGR